MKALKILVTAMGVLIIAGIGLVGYGLSRGKPKPVATPGVEAVAAAGVFATQYPVPKGAKLEQVSAAGDRVVLRFSSAEGDKLVLIDSHTGQLAGTVTLAPDSK
jgi:hypothetical protein